MTPGRISAMLKLAEFSSHFFGVPQEEIIRFVEERRDSGGERYSSHTFCWQDDILEQEIPRGASVLDLGCGGGELLARLIDRREVRGQGIELASEAVADCVARGVPVIQSDLDYGLKGFPDNSFDFVVLEETLQTLRRPMEILKEMLRVGKRGAVSFPNFAFWKVWVDFAVRGRMPMTGNLPYQWYDSPNIHLFTYRDFADWADSSGVILSKVFVRSGEDARPFEEGDDFRGEEMLVFVEKGEVLS